MSYNGAGVFNLYTPGNPVVTGTTVSSSWANNTLSDIASGLSTAVTKDGQTTTTAKIAFAQGIDVSSVANSFYFSTTFTATLTGCTTAPTYSVKVTKIGNQVTINVPTVTGTSNAITKTLTGMPATYRPAAQVNGVGVGSDNGGANAFSTFDVTAAGVIELAYQVGGAWTNSGTFIFSEFTFTYTTA